MIPQAPKPEKRRVGRTIVNILLVPAWALVAFISIDSFQKYAVVGDLSFLTLIMLFALWAWWYGEDRDRRRAAKLRQTEGLHHPPATE
jgi:hypothetical protein